MDEADSTAGRLSRSELEIGGERDVADVAVLMACRTLNFVDASDSKIEGRPNLALLVKGERGKGKRKTAHSQRRPLSLRIFKWCIKILFYFIFQKAHLIFIFLSHLFIIFNIISFSLPGPAILFLSSLFTTMVLTDACSLSQKKSSHLLAT